VPKEIQKSRSGWEEFARVAMATTSLGLAVGGVAGASTITEGTPPAPAQFPGSFPGFVLPVGTTTVLGTIPQATEEWFEFQGLQPGQAYSVHGSVTANEEGTRLFVYNSSDTLIAGGPGGLGFHIGEFGGATAAGTIPSDGKLILETTQPMGPGTATYDIVLTAPLAPPSTSTSVPAASPWSLSALGIGLALTGGLASRSKRGAEG